MTWNPFLINATDSLLSSLQRKYRINQATFSHRPLSQHPITRRKYLSA